MWLNIEGQFRCRGARGLTAEFYAREPRGIVGKLAAGDELRATSVNKFRALNDLTPELFRTWQMCRGNFEPYNTYCDTKMFPLMVRPKQAIKAIYEQKYKLICLNDNVHIRNYDTVIGNLRAAFESILPEKSTFETHSL